MLRFERAGKIIVINGWSGNFHLYVSGGEDVSKVYVVPAGIPACRQAGNLYQKFRKLLFYPFLPAARQGTTGPMISEI
jgi:hypothetical protein